MPGVQSRLHRETRTIVVYPEEVKYLLQLEYEEIKIQIKKNRVAGISKLHLPQVNVGLRVQGKFGHMPRKILNILVVAKTQSGKTGAMIAIVKEYKEQHEIPVSNIYIITGHSSTSWKKQTKGRFPECLEKNIYHRPDFNKKGTKNKLVNELKNKKNVLIIMDEVHVAAKKGQSVDKFFKKLKFNDLEYCLKNDIKIVEFSATPDGTLYDLNNWGQYSCILKMEPGEKYIGADDLDTQKRLFQFKDLCCVDRHGIIDLDRARENINEIKQKMVHFNEPMYHIIRTPPAGLQTEVMNAFKGIFPVNEYNYEQWNGETKKNQELSGINDILTKPPEKHTFIFIKEMLRMAVTLHKQYLGVLYERYTKRPNDSVIVQGLVGRATGYDDNGKTIVFTNIDSIVKYRNLWESDFDGNLMIQWKSNTTKSSSAGGTESRGTFNVEANTTSNNNTNNWTYRQAYFKLEDINNFSRKTCKLIYETVKDENGNYQVPTGQQTHNIMENTNTTLYDYFDTNGVFQITTGEKKRGPSDSHWKKKAKTEDDFYSASLDRLTGKMTKLMVDEKFKWSLDKKHAFQFHPAYENINDKNTLIWCLFYRY